MSITVRPERFWTAALGSERRPENAVGTAILDGQVLGVAMAGPALDDHSTWKKELYVRYTYAALHGRSTGSA